MSAVCHREACRCRMDSGKVGICNFPWHQREITHRHLRQRTLHADRVGLHFLNIHFKFISKVKTTPSQSNVLKMNECNEVELKIYTTQTCVLTPVYTCLCSPRVNQRQDYKVRLSWAFCRVLSERHRIQDIRLRPQCRTNRRMEGTLWPHVSLPQSLPSL